MQVIISQSTFLLRGCTVHQTLGNMRTAAPRVKAHADCLPCAPAGQNLSHHACTIALTPGIIHMLWWLQCQL